MRCSPGCWLGFPKYSYAALKLPTLEVHPSCSPALQLTSADIAEQDVMRNCVTAVLQLFDAARPRFGQTLLDGKRIQ
jgi:hypothetical protein